MNCAIYILIRLNYLMTEAHTVHPLRYLTIIMYSVLWLGRVELKFNSIIHVVHGIRTVQ